MQPLDGGGREDEDDALEAEDDDDDEEEQEAVAGADDRSSEQAGSDAESSDESAEDESDASGDEQAAIPDGNLVGLTVLVAEHAGNGLVSNPHVDVCVCVYAHTGVLLPVLHCKSLSFS